MAFCKNLLFVVLLALGASQVYSALDKYISFSQCEREHDFDIDPANCDIQDVSIAGTNLGIDDNEQLSFPLNKYVYLMMSYEPRTDIVDPISKVSISNGEVSFEEPNWVEDSCRFTRCPIKAGQKKGHTFFFMPRGEPISNAVVTFKMQSQADPSVGCCYKFNVSMIFDDHY